MPRCSEQHNSPLYGWPGCANGCERPHDELPQLFNVLKGNMSLVGPRPDLLQLDDYTPMQARRFEVMPGMTGLWQVSGKNSLSFDQMIELDLRYIDHISLQKDLSILFRTIGVLINYRNE